jgi:hypothetical protein
MQEVEGVEDGMQAVLVGEVGEEMGGPLTPPVAWYWHGMVLPTQGAVGVDVPRLSREVMVAVALSS